MEIQYWPGGLTQHEVEAIEKIKKNFSSNKAQTNPKPTKIKGGLDVLEQLKPKSSIFPWKGYAGFRFADAKNSYEGEFDLVIITHCNVLIIELKHWNGEITGHSDKWFQNGEDRGRSPVSITRKKQELLEKKLDKYKNQFSNKGFRPQIHFLVVISGNADFSSLPEEQLNHTMRLQDFLNLKDENQFNKRFHPHPNSRVLNHDFAIFDDLFINGKNVKVKAFRKNGYIIEEQADFEHPNKIYQEYLAKAEKINTDKALIRRWDFSKINDPSAQTPDGRYRLVSREYDVLEHIKVADEELYQDCLSHKLPPSQEEITADYADIFSILPSNKRFNSFIGEHAKQMKPEERLGLVQLLLDKFARLHKAKIAHRDLAAHSIWISAGKKITLSGFISAYYPEKGTVGDIREVLSVSGNQDLASQSYPPLQTTLTAFEHDIRSLAVLAWHIVQAERLSPASLSKLKTELDNCTEWYAEVFRQALSEHPFPNGKVFLTAFKKVQPESAVDFSFDYGKLEQYTRDINHSRHYREDEGTDFIVERSNKEVYQSNGLLVKAWLNIQYKNNDAIARNLYYFLEKVARLQSLVPDYVPTIRDFGIASKSGSLYMVSDFIQGYSWDELASLELPLDAKYEAINKLIHAIEHLHDLGLAHGDLHPDNVRITLDSDGHPILYLLDILDYTANGKNNLNYRYAPEEAEQADEVKRDNFAVMRMSCELLGIKWGQESETFPNLADAICTELSDRQAGFLSLERFQDALKPKEQIKFIEIFGKDGEERKIYPKNGELFVQLESSNKDKNKIRVRFIGIGGTFDAIFNPTNNQFESAFGPRDKDEIYRKEKDNSVLSIPFGLSVLGTKYFSLDKLNAELTDYQPFKQAIIDFQTTLSKTPQSNDEPFISIVEKTDDTFQETVEMPELDPISALSLSEVITPVFERPHIKDLWSAILDTETEALPYVNVVVEYKKDNKGSERAVPKIAQSGKRWFIHYETEADAQVLDRFRKDDVVELIARDLEKDRDRKIGKLDLANSTGSLLCLKTEPKNTHILRNNPIIYLQSRQTAASFKRRKNALQRVLDGESVINQLVEYFDEKCALSAISYDIAVNDEDFARYDRDNGRISLNEAQRTAFARLLQNGPLSLLQGPPGTGKTEFIAAFVHFLFEKQNVKNILLVSQSHEAVNTAAERIRNHCQRLDTNIDIVRFSNRETAVSLQLQDVFSQNLISEKRETLRIKQLDRISQMGSVLGLQNDYLHQRAELQLDIGSQVKRYERLMSDNIPENEEDDLKARNKLCKEIANHIREQAKHTDITTNFDNLDIQAILPALIGHLDNHFGIQPKESAQANELIKLTQDIQEALSNERVSYDEFLARSKQLVAGTCVGMGQGHIGIADNTYDWVIIDEAARSISSELAIAMQSGKRILLVGDHKQLPPLYSTEHKNALAHRLGIRERGEELDQILGSDFERVFESSYGKETCATLTTQYRMAPAIGSLVSQCFYDGELKNGKQQSDVPAIYTSLPQKIQSCVTWLDTAKLPNALHSEKETSLTNEAEAKLVIELLKKLSENEELLSSNITQRCLEENEALIGIICMYAKQRDLIRKKFNAREWNEHFKSLVKIDTVDSYQGKENRIIILSVTRNDKHRTPGFLRLPNRINVALSRAMDKLIIVGAADMWRGKNSSYPLGKVLNMMESSEDPVDYAVKQEKNTTSQPINQIKGK